MPEEDHIEIERQDLLLAELALQALRDEDLLQLAADGLLLREERAARRLHGDGARALAFAGGHVDEQRAHDALPVEAVMLEELIVLGGDERVLDDLRYLLVSHGVAPLLADLRDKLAARGVDAQRHRQLVVLHRGDRRQRWFQVYVSTDEGVRDANCDRRHTHQQLREDSKVVWLHRIRVSSVARALCPMHSNRRRYAYSPKGGDAKLPV
jgi:hypothetical protein